MGWDPILLPDKPWRRPGIPTLGAACRHFREYRRLSREAVCERIGIGTSHLFRIEVQGLIPSADSLDVIIEGLDLDKAQARHLRELRVPTQQLEPTHELRTRVTSNAAQMAHLEDLESRGVLAAYVDPMASILACNNLFRTAMPGIDDEDVGSYPVWLFTPIARQVFADWEHEADHCVAATKGILGTYRDARQSQDLLRRLRNTKEFRNRWAASINISFGRATNDLMLLSDPARKVVTAYTFSHSIESRSVLLYVGFPKDNAALPLP